MYDKNLPPPPSDYLTHHYNKLAESMNADYEKINKQIKEERNRVAVLIRHGFVDTSKNLKLIK